MPKWATDEEFRRLEDLGLTMYGQMTAGSWIYIGTQGILQGTFETLAELARQHFAGSLKGKFVLTAGLGGMGGAQPLAITMNEGVALIAEVDRERIARRLASGYLDRMAESLDDALRQVERAQATRPRSQLACWRNAVDVHEALLARNVVPDVVTDQTSAHDLVWGYVPAGISLPEADALRSEDPDEYARLARQRRSVTSKPCSSSNSAAPSSSTTATTSASRRSSAASTNAFDFPGFVPAYIRPMFARGKGPFRWVALSGDPEDIFRTDRLACELFPDERAARALARSWRVKKSSSRACPRASAGSATASARAWACAINELVRRGKLKAPIVIGRDHLDAGSVASPNRETERMRDGSDAIADWPILNALVNTAAGASWISVHHGGGVGIGYSLHAGHGRRRRRHRPRRAQARTRADLRPGHGRRAPRRRWLRGRRRVRARQRRAPAQPGHPAVTVTLTPARCLSTRWSKSPDDDALVSLSTESYAAMTASRAVVERAAAVDEAVVYGVTTGLGALATTHISPPQRLELQRALIRSHAAGSGPPLEREVVRAMMLLRAATLSRGYSGGAGRLSSSTSSPS